MTSTIALYIFHGLAIYGLWTILSYKAIHYIVRKRIAFLGDLRWWVIILLLPGFLVVWVRDE
jgi:hypothetical protein